MTEVNIAILPDGRVSRRDAASFLGYQPKTLAEWYRLGKGPRSRMVGGRRFYHIDDLRTFATSTTLSPEGA
ncbi:DNA-binding protein [Sphingomonas sp. PB2P19]|uniref:DNA-binding protein n=1 Tax=Sphingomonas rhamnosi TaxID=3096156 RepID=UPI002FC666CD